MSPQDYFNQCYRLDARINSDMEELRALREMQTTVAGFGEEKLGQFMPSQTAPFEHTVAKILELEAKIRTEIDTRVALKDQARTVIEAIPDVDEKLTMRYRYIHDMDWDAICFEMHADRTTVYRWHISALEHAIVPADPIII